MCLFLNCEEQADENIYYGLYAFEDLHFSNPLIIDFDAKKVLSATPEFNTDVYSLTDSTLLKEDLVFKLNYKGSDLKTERDSMVVHIFKRVVSERPRITDKSEILKILRSKTWLDESINLTKEESLNQTFYYKFNDSIISKLTHYSLDKEIVHSEVEEYHYKIVDFGGRFFLYLKSPNLESRFSSFLELKSLTQKNITFSGIKGYQDLKLASSNKDKFFKHLQNKFVVCNEDLIGQYYYNDLGSNYDGGLRRIKELLKNRYISTNNEHDSGYIRIRFVVNCMGQTGRFSILQVDKEYQPIRLTTSLMKQLLDFMISLPDWKLGRLTDDGKPYDNYRHITFKIENGQVLEIFP